MPPIEFWERLDPATQTILCGARLIQPGRVIDTCSRPGPLTDDLKLALIADIQRASGGARPPTGRPFGA